MTVMEAIRSRRSVRTFDSEACGIKTVFEISDPEISKPEEWNYMATYVIG